MIRVPNKICFLFLILSLQLICAADRSELNAFVMEGAREIGSSSADGYEEVFFVITAEYPANNKIKMLGDILMGGGYKNCMPAIPEWQSYYNIKGEVFFDRQMVGVSESDNKIVFVVFSYKGLSLDSPGNTEMFVSVQRFVFSSKEGLEDALKYLDVKCDWLL